VKPLNRLWPTTTMVSVHVLNRGPGLPPKPGRSGWFFVTGVHRYHMRTELEEQLETPKDQPGRR